MTERTQIITTTAAAATTTTTIKIIQFNSIGFFII
jgi:hypothetical protein